MSEQPLGFSPNDASRIAKAVRYVEHAGPYLLTGAALVERRPQLNGVQVLILTSPIGSAGSDTGPCTFTYTCTKLDGVLFGSSMSPQVTRPSIGELVAANYGLGYYDISGTAQLLIAFESLYVGPTCNPS